MVVDSPVAVQRQVLWLRCAENCGASAVAVLGSSSSWTRLLCRLVQRPGVAECLVRLWIHALHYPGWLLEEFHDFLRDWVSRLLRSILRPGRHVVVYGSGMRFSWFAGFSHLALCSRRLPAGPNFFSSRAALGNLYIISTSPLYFQHFSAVEILR